MSRALLFSFLLFITNAGFAQSDKDTLMSKLPIVNDTLIYKGDIKVQGHNKATLDSMARKWFTGYFAEHTPDTLAKDKDPNATLVQLGLLEFRIATTSLALVKYKFYIVTSVKVVCKDNICSYTITPIYFIPKSGMFRALGYYQTSPTYLIGLYIKSTWALSLR